jgi:hypothetical protein
VRRRCRLAGDSTCAFDHAQPNNAALFASSGILDRNERAEELWRQVEQQLARESIRLNLHFSGQKR